MGKFDTAEARWAGIGPYYAMFPARFADHVVEKYTEEGETVIDPFAGRGTALFSAAVRDRHALGVEINPVGWIYAATKLNAPASGRVAARVQEIGRLASRFRRQAANMPLFYTRCFSPNVLSFLLAARSHLDWRSNIVDRATMAFLLIDLHGKRENALSNQLRQTKAMSPAYAVRWWSKRNLRPPKRDPVQFLLKKMEWRYARGIPDVADSRVYLGDSSLALPALRASASLFAPNGARLLLTSPPYFAITNYHYDQWLRLWLLGGSVLPKSLRQKHRGKFLNPFHYRELLLKAFSQAKNMLAEDAVVYVRTDRRAITAQVTRSVLQIVFPNHRLSRRSRPLNGQSQTRLFGNVIPTIGEIDLILTRT
jgi:hypothetical protein